MGLGRPPKASLAIQGPVLDGSLPDQCSSWAVLWAVLYPFPHLAGQVWFTSMLLAWSATEVIRYSFFALALCGVDYAALTWLRYSTFTVLYPIGISGECWLIYRVAAEGNAAPRLHPFAPYVLYGVLVLYIPGSYVLYGRMLGQRKKVLAKRSGGKAGKAE